MKIELLSMLRCPRTGQSLTLVDQIEDNGEVISGTLISADGVNQYPIRGGIPRFVPSNNYADNFGMQWNHFSKTQLDSYTGIPISSNRFWIATNWDAEDLKDKWVLDIGCGAGRFAEVALRAGAKVVALDYSSAVDACSSNLGNHPNLYIVQGDVYCLPFAHNNFPYVYSLGVLQHTPDVARAFIALTSMVKPGGSLCVDYYWKRLRTMLHMKYVLRPLTKRMAQDKLFALLQCSTPFMLKISQALGAIPILGLVLSRLIPVANYTGIFPLTNRQLQEWALLDTFDWFAPAYDNPQTIKTVKQWFKNANFCNIYVAHHGHLVARGNKPL